ncbi:MAG: peptide ABC transporter substrate-binding protein, partial [Cyanobacteria bacterium J069]
MLSRRWQRRLLPLLFSALLCVGLAIACDTSQPSTQDAAPSAADTASSTLKLLYWQAPTILNPHLSNGFKDSEASRITLEPLASYNAEGNLVPFLAADIPTLENDGIAPDGRFVIWKLKPGLKWSDGAPFSAADVVFTHQFVTDPAVAAISAASYEPIESVEALDETTVKITFKESNPAWSNVFVGTEGMVLPQHQFAAYLGAKSREAPANLMPVGTGPYRVVEFKPGDVVIFEPNPNYREADSLGFSRIELKGGGDAVSAARAVLQTGDVDFAYNLQVEAPILEQLTGRGEVVANFGSLMERILINFSDPNAEVDGERSHVSRPHPFLTDLQVRQALSLAVDREAIATQLYGRTGK